MIRSFIILLLLVWSGGAFSQVNYVSNGDFETYSKCPDGNGGDRIWYGTGWKPLDTLTRNPDGTGNHNCSADYCNTCAPSTAHWASVPLSSYYYQYPHSYDGMADMYIYTIVDSTGGNYYLREYIQSRLIKKLSAGKRYCVSFYVNLAEISGYAIKEISAYFDNGAIDATPFCGLAQSQYTPQVTNSGGPITDTAGWTKIEGSFIANGNEQFITIGNFKDKAGTTTVTAPRSRFNASSGTTYYLVDDVSVVESTTKADAGPDTHVGYGDSVYIGLPSSEVIWNSWAVLGSLAVMGNGPGIWVKPKTTTSYVVTQTLCGNTTKDTVKVEVWPAGVTTIGGRTQHYTLSPNPGDGFIQLQQLEEDRRPVSISIYDMVGSLVTSASQSFAAKAASLNLEGVAAGLYHVIIRDAEGSVYTIRFVKK